MSQQLHTRCPHCSSAFRFDAELLDIANGRAKCGDCKQVFNASAWLIDVPSDINSQLESIVDQYQLDALTELGSPSQGLGDLDLSADFSFSAKDPEPQPETPKQPQTKSDNDRIEPVMSEAETSPTTQIQPDPKVRPAAPKRPKAAPQQAPKLTPAAVQQSPIKAKSKPTIEAEIAALEAQLDAEESLDHTTQQEASVIATEKMAASKQTDIRATVGPDALDQTDLDFSLNTAPEDISDDMAALVNQSSNEDDPALGQVEDINLHDLNSDELSNDEAEALFATNPAFASNLSLEDEDIHLDDFDLFNQQDGESLQPANAPLKSPISAKNRQRNEERDKVLEQLMGEETAKKRSSVRPLIWLLLATIIVVVGAGEWIWLQRDTFAHQDNRRPWLETMCGVIGCEVPAYRNLKKIAISNRDMRSHPDDPQGLQLNALLTNKAQWHQQLPELDLSFSDIKQQVIAQRIFKPEEYLRDKGLLNKMMKPDLPVQIQLELKDPGESAVNFELKLIEPERTTLF
ncbi:zinc-ribbon and DUF3426 domain-containing protein [Pelagibaculum spongiae]|uniref:Zinc finger/thioredoxin putative domain-containing protein n=1 Tax=Pelagibaculum spongiae TaxID=2080658 RepID=A0A2V1GXN7_9GAMM|nr:zinc-ribbon and DUF3426 domain-containing protein [Pelagibaculum spongiae]PVZ66272.1 hypothetical protein DC094_16325 [Pelagibaculum spongiae]